MKITLKVFENDSLILSKSFDNGVFRVGRSELSDLVIQGSSVSRSAFELRVTDSSVYVTNMGAPGKLKINGRKQETGELKEGSTVEVGNYKITILWGEEEVQSQPSVNEPAKPDQELAEDNILAADKNVLGDNGLFSDNPLGEFKMESPEANLELKSENDDADKSPKGDEPSKVFEFPNPEPAIIQQGSEMFDGNLALKEKTDTVGKPLVAKILILEGPRAGQEIPLQAYELSFGRSSKADVVISDKKLSRIHAKIIRFGTGYRIIDLNSQNGTRVNGVRILEHPLSSYDVVEFGNTKLQFLIHDLVLNEKSLSTNLVVSSRDATKSLLLEEKEKRELSQIANENLEAAPGTNQELSAPEEVTETKTRSPLKIIFAVILAVALALWILSINKKEAENPKPKAAVEAKETQTEKNIASPKVPSEFLELSDDMQRRIEGLYNSALVIFQKPDVEVEELEKARDNLRKIHQSLPYYKNSKELMLQLDRRYRAKVEQLAAERAKKNAMEDLNIYLEDGIEYLKQGEFDRAAESFTRAASLDPRNKIAIDGLRAVELKVRDLENLPAERNPEEEKRQKIKELYEQALQQFNNRAYQEAIDLAEQMRKINLKSDQSYLNEAKQIIDRARIAQKEEFEPFLIQAKEKYSEGDYNASRDLCEEMLKRDAAYEDAKELLAKAKKQLNRLAKEAYTHGYILESIGQIEQAKQYWNRAKNYVRTGDEYYEKVNKKLEQYQ